ncbi:MAG TPA: hypothetical protein VIK89_15975 [Cytophagaceae bacterium]
MNIRLPHIIVFLVCIISRIATAVYHVEDPESMHFALSILDYDLTQAQPDFPGYPVFCFIVKLLYLITGSIAVSFALVGGVATYLIIYYSLQLLKVPLLSFEGGLTALLLFFNPMIWIMSNRYMSDLLGVALILAILYYLLPEHYDRKKEQIGWFLVGILAGVQLTYVPFILIPVVYVFFRQYTYTRSVQMMMAGTAIWMIPLIADTGWNELIHTAINQWKIGAFTPEVVWDSQLLFLFKNVWTDALAGFWIGRPFITLITSAGVVACCIFGCFILLSFGYTIKHIRILLAAAGMYVAWIYFCQELVLSSRSVLPLVPFIVMAVSYGIIYFLVNYNFIYVKAALFAFILVYMGEGVLIAREHTFPTAIAQVKDYLQNETPGADRTIVSTPLINYYLQYQKVTANYISVDSLLGNNFYGEKTNLREALRQNIFSGKVYVIGNFPYVVQDKQCQEEKNFRHDPYINRIWPDITVFKYE